MAIGLSGGLYGMLAGGLIGFMVDSIRGDRRLRRYLSESEAPAPPEPLAGLAASLAIAMRFPPPGDNAGGEPVSKAKKRELVTALVQEILRSLVPIHRFLYRPGPAILLYLIEGGCEVDVAVLSKRLWLEGSRDARFFLATAAWAIRREEGTLTPAKETSTRRLLARAGVPIEDIEAARRRFFPDYRSPWDILGIDEGSSPQELRQAWRRLSLLYHPDTLREGTDETALRFREIKSAYDTLTDIVEEPRAAD
jgi:hypothetical protein